jgi:hypothetical protein
VGIKAMPTRHAALERVIARTPADIDRLSQRFTGITRQPGRHARTGEPPSSIEFGDGVLVRRPFGPLRLIVVMARRWRGQRIAFGIARGIGKRIGNRIRVHAIRRHDVTSCVWECLLLARLLSAYIRRVVEAWPAA